MEKNEIIEPNKQQVNDKVILLDNNLMDKIMLFIKKDSGYSIKTKRTYSQNIKMLFEKYDYINKNRAKKIAKESNPNKRAMLGLIKKTSEEYDLNIPTFNFQPPHRQQRKPPENIYSIEKVREIINILPDPNSKLFFKMIFNVGAGLRISEAIKVKWIDIDWQNWIKNKDGYGNMRIKTKRGKYNSLTVPSNIMQELFNKSNKDKVICSEFSIDGIHTISYPNDDKFIFDFNIKKFENYDYYYKFEKEKFLDIYVRKVYDQVQIHLVRKYINPFLGHRFKPHSFRHSRATQLLREGVPLAIISKTLGHQRLETTMIYLDIDSTEQAKFLSNVQNL